MFFLSSYSHKTDSERVNYVKQTLYTDQKSIASKITDLDNMGSDTETSDDDDDKSTNTL
jgi:hypothetical protein